MKHSKRLLALLLVLALSLSLAITTAVAAGDGLTITVGTVSGQAGENVTVPVTISNNPGILSAKLEFSFDSTALELTGMANGEIFTGTEVMFEPNPAKATAVLDNSTADDAVSGNGTLLTLTFKIKESAAAGDCEVNVTVTQIVGSNFTNVTAAAVAGKVTVVASEAEGPTIDDVISKPGESVLPADSITFSGSTMTITPTETTPACVVLIKNGDNYSKVTATKNGDKYDFDVSNLPEGTSIVVAVKGDANGDGGITVADYIAIARSLQPSSSNKYAALDALGGVVGDANGDGSITVADYIAVARSLQPSSSNKYATIEW